MASRGGGRGGGRAAYNPNDGYGGRGGGGQYYGGRGGGGGNADGGAGRGRGYVQGQGGGDGGGRGRGRGYQGGGDGGGRGRGYQGGGDGGGRGRGYQGGGDGGGRGRGRGYQQGGNDYGGGGRGYQQGGNDYGGGRGGGRGGGGRGGAGPSHPPAPAVLQPTGPPISDRYREEAAKLREKFKALDISRADPTFPARPGFGTGGQLCRVRANHFFVGLVDKGLHQYDVAISPEPTLKGVFRAVMSNLVREHQTTSLGGCLPAYDGRKSLYTAGELPFTSKEFDVILPDNRPGRERTFKVTIKHATLVSLQQLQMLMAGISTDIPAQALQVLDIVLRDIVLNERTDMGCVPVGRSFFSQNIDAPVELGLGIQGWTGFYQSMRPTQSGLSLNVDMSSTAFVQAGRLLDFIGKVLDWKDLRYLNQVDYLKIKKALRGLRVEVTHRGEVRRKYRITSLTNDPARDLRFQLSTGETKTVRDYFRETYNLQLKLDFLPCLNVGTDKKANYLPLEVCNIVPGQKYQKKLDDHQVSNMMKMACKGPTEREANILKSVRDNMYNTANRANEFGIEVDDNPTVVQARVLPAPMLKYHGSGSCNPQNGAWNMMGKKVVHGVDVGIWACVNFCHDLSGDEVVHFCEELKEVSTRTGVNFQRARRKIFHARPDQAEAKLREVQKEVRDMNMKIDFLLAILPDKNGNLYGDIKRICETDIGLMTQCCLRKNVERSNKQFLANVALKINAKCGGRNSVFANIPESLPVVSSKPTIIFGADVTHPKALDDFSPSIASVVASQDWPEVTKYHGDVHAQGRHEELIQGLEDIVKKLLRSFENQSKQRPRQLIFYRDGVSEGQFRQVLEKEIPEIEKAWQSLYNEKAPITFIVVQKRHHTRLFPTESKYQDKSGNILPGTVVDRQICHPTEFDFFLCSHAGIKGTSRPAHYHVLRDDNKFTADALQSLTNNLCYTYASCTRSVSTAPPAYYAHKLAFRARFYQSQDNDMATEVSFGSATKTDGSGSKPPPVPSLPEIKDELKRLMFYC